MAQFTLAWGNAPGCFTRQKFQALKARFNLSRVSRILSRAPLARKRNEIGPLMIRRFFGAQSGIRRLLSGAVHFILNVARRFPEPFLMGILRPVLNSSQAIPALAGAARQGPRRHVPDDAQSGSDLHFHRDTVAEKPLSGDRVRYNLLLSRGHDDGVLAAFDCGVLRVELDHVVSGLQFFGGETAIALGCAFEGSFAAGIGNNHVDGRHAAVRQRSRDQE